MTAMTIKTPPHIVRRTAAAIINPWSMPNGGYTFFMMNTVRRINGGDLVRHGARRPEAGTPIYKYIGIGSGVSQAPLPLPLNLFESPPPPKS